jgi:hypothetical protein
MFYRLRTGTVMAFESLTSINRFLVIGPVAQGRHLLRRKHDERPTGP